MRRLVRVLAVFVCLAVLGGCTRSGPEELMETAKFEELQQNVPHARKLYQEIVDRYPDSEEAKVARERLAALAKESPE